MRYLIYIEEENNRGRGEASNTDQNRVCVRARVNKTIVHFLSTLQWKAAEPIEPEIRVFVVIVVVVVVVFSIVVKHQNY